MFEHPAQSCPCIENAGILTHPLQQRGQIELGEEKQLPGAAFGNPGLAQALAHPLRTLPVQLVECGECSPHPLRRHPVLREQSPDQLSIGDPGHEVLTRESERAEDVDSCGNDLGIGQLARLSYDVEIQLEVLTKSSLLRTLVAKQLRYRVPADRLGHSAGPCPDHAGEGRCHLGPERDIPPALIAESIQLSHDFLAGLPDIQIQGLERRTIVLDETVPSGDLAPDCKYVVSERHLLRVEIAKSGQARKIHRRRKLRAAEAEGQ